MNPLVQSTTRFDRVRDGRESPDAYFDVDLTNAGDRIINIAGNSFYIDANPADGNAVVYFQDTDNLRGPTPFYVSPGFIARIPFTQIRVTNTSQPGKKIRIVYGIDTDFQPGSVSQVSFAGEVTINDVITINSQSVYFAGSSPVAFNVNNLLLPAANINGLNLKAASVTVSTDPTGTTSAALIAAPVAPAAFAGATRAVMGLCRGNNGTSGSSFEYNMARLIPAGWGLYLVHASSVVPGGVEGQATFQLL